MEQTLSWVDMVDLDIQVDYDAIIFPMEDGSDGTSELHPTQPGDGTEIQGESGPSAESETPPSVELQQDSSSSADSGSLNSEDIQPSPRSEKPRNDLRACTSSQAPHSYPQYFKSDKTPEHASAVTVIPPSLDIEQAIKRISDLTQQVDDLKQELQGKVFDLHEERERRIKFQVDCKAQLEQIQQLEKSLEHERHMRLKCEEKVEKQETLAAPQTAGASRFPRIPKVTVHESVLNELQFFKRRAEKNALNSERLAEALVAEQQLRAKYEDQLRSNYQEASRFKEQQETITSLKSQVGEPTVELNLALKNQHPKVSSQTEASTQTGPQRNRTVHEVRDPQHEHRRQNTNRGFNANPGLYPHADHHKNGGSHENRRRPPYRGQ
ncbi:uncharacterized protein LOC118566225 [Fundulus heteroclitus]|uniref:uncharacterized protein LOC118566225 n=1 Tax=Fundulus heteroclitus TaxID=8078 RepID=UPI00165BFC86|nr:uncharacterized protein LOC118566225 [Fundulus heteroclitus]